MENNNQLMPYSLSKMEWQSMDGASRAEKINRLHQVAEGCHKISVQAALAAGLELIKAKEECPHGTWLLWIKQNCRFHRKTADRYMAIANTVLRVTEHQEYIEADIIPAEAIECAADELDGKTISQLYKGMGLVKATKDWGGVRAGAGRKAKDFSDVVAAVTQDPNIAAIEVNKPISDLIAFASQGAGFNVLDTLVLMRLGRELKQLASRIDEILAERGA